MGCYNTKICVKALCCNPPCHTARKARCGKFRSRLPLGSFESLKIAYFIGETTYSNRKFDITDPNKLLILSLLLKCPFIYQAINIIS